MKTVEDILVETYGVGLKKALTDEEVSVMMSGDKKLFLAMPDSKKNKMTFVESMVKKYIEFESHLDFWQSEKERLKNTYPAIHGDLNE